MWSSHTILNQTLCVENLTLPKDPVPRVTPTSKSLKLMGVGNVRTCDVILELHNERQIQDLFLSDIKFTVLSFRRRYNLDLSMAKCDEKQF